ncbi:hypothetical protein SESBI_06015 [Sesbania bispinosa]|nr:hypothetical protein SESBI_06015 [Sesbania bispinosa]
MDFEYQNDKSWSKILSRRSSVGCSSRISYYRSGEGVPFQWEMQPGIPKDQSPTEELPPLTPPPAILSLGLPKPCIVDPEPSTRKSRLWFWKKRGKNKKQQEEECFSEDVIDFDVLDCSSDSESMASPRDSSFSFSSSSSLSLMKSHPIRQVHGRSFTLGCFPTHGVLISIARRD